MFDNMHVKNKPSNLGHKNTNYRDTVTGGKIFYLKDSVFRLFVK